MNKLKVNWAYLFCAALIKSPKVFGPFASLPACAAAWRALFNASFSSASSFALIDKLIARDLRSTLMIFASTSWPTSKNLVASSTRSRLISDALRVASISSANLTVAPLASTAVTVPLTKAPRSFAAKKSLNGSLFNCLIPRLQWQLLTKLSHLQLLI